MPACPLLTPILLLSLIVRQAPPPSPIPGPQAPIAITGNTLVQPHQLVMLDVVGGPFDSVTWRVFPPPQAVYTGRRNGLGYDFAGSPGVYTVWAVGAFVHSASGKAITSDDSVSVVLQSPEPAPAPTPGPGPGPGPIPPPNPVPPTPVVAGKIWAVAVFDTANLLGLPQAQIDMRGGASASLIASLQPLDCVWRSYDVGSPVLAGSSWQAAIKTSGVPGLILTEEIPASNPRKAKIISAQPLPIDEAATVAAVAKLRGK